MRGDPNATPISTRLPAEVIERLDKIAAALERPRSWVILRAIKLYLADEGQEVLDVAEGIAELDRGEGVDFDEAMAGFEAILKKNATPDAAG